MTETPDLMSEFRKLQSETTRIHSQLAGKSSLNLGSLIENKLANNIHDFCEKTTELHINFNKEVMKKLDLVSNKLNEQDKLANEIQSLRTEFKKTVEFLKSNQENSIKKALEEYRSMKKSLESIKNSYKNNNKVTNSGNDSIEHNKPQTSEKTEENKKKFVLKVEFDEIFTLSSTWRYSDSEDYFGASWNIIILRKKDHFSICLKCSVPKTQEWSLECQGECKLKAIDGSFRSFHDTATYSNNNSARGCSELIKWDDLVKDYVSDGIIYVEIDIKISKVVGVYKKSSRRFDDTMQGYSDTVLIVQDRKFHVFKLFLSAQSTYFKTLLDDCLTGSEIAIDNVESEDFHVFLGVLYGDQLDESTVEITLLLAEQFDAKIVARRCEHFLINKSQKTMKKKLQLAIRYKLEELKKTCIDSIKSAADIRSIIPTDLTDMDHSTLAALMEKTLTLVPK